MKGKTGQASPPRASTTVAGCDDEQAVFALIAPSHSRPHSYSHSHSFSHSHFHSHSHFFPVPIAIPILILHTHSHSHPLLRPHPPSLSHSYSAGSSIPYRYSHHFSFSTPHSLTPQSHCPTGTYFQFYPRSPYGFIASFPSPFLSQMEADHRKGSHREVSRGQLALGGIQRRRSGAQWRWEAKAKGPLRHREEYSAREGRGTVEVGSRSEGPIASLGGGVGQLT